MYILKGGRKLPISTENLLLCSTPLEIRALFSATLWCRP